VASVQPKYINGFIYLSGGNREAILKRTVQYVYPSKRLEYKTRSAGQTTMLLARKLEELEAHPGGLRDLVQSSGIFAGLVCGGGPVSKSTLTHLGLQPTSSLAGGKWLAATEGRTLDSEHGSRGKYGTRENFSSRKREECLSGDLLNEERIVRVGLMLALSLQDFQNELVAGPQPSIADRVADRSIAGHGRARRNERFSFSMSPTTETKPIVYASRCANSPIATKHRADKLSRRQEKCSTRIGR